MLITFEETVYFQKNVQAVINLFIIVCKVALDCIII